MSLSDPSSVPTERYDGGADTSLAARAGAGYNPPPPPAPVPPHHHHAATTTSRGNYRHNPYAAEGIPAEYRTESEPSERDSSSSRQQLAANSRLLNSHQPSMVNSAATSQYNTPMATPRSVANNLPPPPPPAYASEPQPQHPGPVGGAYEYYSEGGYAQQQDPSGQGYYGTNNNDMGDDEDCSRVACVGTIAQQVANRGKPGYPNHVDPYPHRGSYNSNSNYSQSYYSSSSSYGPNSHQQYGYRADDGSLLDWGAGTCGPAHPSDDSMTQCLPSVGTRDVDGDAQSCVSAYYPSGHYSSSPVPGSAYDENFDLDECGSSATAACLPPPRYGARGQGANDGENPSCIPMMGNPLQAAKNRIQGTTIRVGGTRVNTRNLPKTTAGGERPDVPKDAELEVSDTADIVRTELNGYVPYLAFPAQEKVKTIAAELTAKAAIAQAALVAAATSSGAEGGANEAPKTPYFPIFFGQVSFSADRDLMMWLIEHLTGIIPSVISNHGPGCFTCYFRSMDECQVVLKSNKRVLFDKGGVWLARNEPEQQLLYFSGLTHHNNQQQQEGTTTATVRLPRGSLVVELPIVKSQGANLRGGRGRGNGASLGGRGGGSGRGRGAVRPQSRSMQ